jgi:ubiquinone/menaquinone biosynthesis C-methylase UbiE
VAVTGDSVNVWIARSKVSLDEKYKGVLFSNFPNLLNDYLHQWTSQLITSHITEKDRYILDLGCGYGRLSLMIREKFPEALLTGLDISPYYTREYIRNIHRAFSVTSNSVYLPFKKLFFDIIFEVFSLMYLTNKEEYKQALREMFGSLKDDGSILIIENNRIGTYLLNGFGVLSFFSKIVHRKYFGRTKGLLFNYCEIDEMVQQNHGMVMKKIGMPVFTLFIPLNVLFAFLSEKLLSRWLSIISVLDGKLQFLNFLSLYQFYLIKKRKKAVS